MTRKIIIDCDPGIDDAVAICIALFDPRLDVLATTPTAGTVEAAQATTNVTAIIRQLDPPRYPRSAERRNISGWVDVVFTVNIDGSVTDVEVIGSEPGDTFVDSATKAVQKWQFEPVVEDGQIVEKRASVRMMFAIE